MEIKIKINGKEYKVKQSLRALMLFEQITGRFATEITPSINDTVVLFYSLLKSNNKDFEISQDELIDIIDEQPEILDNFNDYLLSLQTETEQPQTKKKVNQSK